VYEINARWTARERRSARRPGKTDRLDAHAIAQLVRQEAPHLPAVHADDVSTLLDVLATEREGIIAEVVRLRNQIHALMTQLDPEYQQHLPRLDSKSGIVAAMGYTTRSKSALQQARAANVRRLAERLTHRIVLTQAHALPEARAYLARRVTEGKTRRRGATCAQALRRVLRLALLGGMRSGESERGSGGERGLKPKRTNSRSCPPVPSGKGQFRSQDPLTIGASHSDKAALALPTCRGSVLP